MQQRVCESRAVVPDCLEAPCSQLQGSLGIELVKVIPAELCLCASWLLCVAGAPAEPGVDISGCRSECGVLPASFTIQRLQDCRLKWIQGGAPHPCRCLSACARCRLGVILPANQ